MIITENPGKVKSNTIYSMKLVLDCSLAKSFAMASQIANIFAANVSRGCTRDWVLCVDAVS